jgi:peptide/nickel transport system ATP-binding protein
MAQRLFRAPRHPYSAALLDSFPSLHGERRQMTGIGGSPPDMRNPPGGCAFHPRCRYALPRCSREIPQLTGPATGSGRRRLVACWLHESGELPGELARPEPDGQPRTPAPLAPQPSRGPR